MAGIVGIGLFCVLLGGMVMFVDPVTVHPDPFGMGLVLILIGIASLAVAYHYRKWRPPPDE